MKKMISGVLIIFLLFLCSCQKVDNDEQLINIPGVERKNDICLDFFSCQRNSSTIVEDDFYIYFGKKDGIYIKEKTSGSIVKLVEVSFPNFLQIVEHILYFKSDGNLYQYSLEDGCKIVIEVKTNEEKAIVAQEYQVYEGKIYFWGELGFASFDLDLKEFTYIPEIISISKAEIQKDTLYYIENEKNIFFSYDLNTGKKNMLLDNIAIKNFVFTRQLYTQQANAEKIYAFEYNAENSIVGYVFEKNPVVYMQNIDGCFVYVCKKENRYFIYAEHTVIGEIEALDIKTGLCIVDGKAYFNANGNPTYIEVKNFYSTEQYDNKYEILELKAYNMFPKTSFIEQESFVDRVTFLQIADEDIYRENLGLFVVGKKGTNTIWKNEYICNAMQIEGHDKDVIITKDKVYFLADFNLHAVSAETGADILRIKGSYSEITASSDGRYIIMADYFGVRLSIFDTVTEKVILKTVPAELNECYELWISENKIVALCSNKEGYNVAAVFLIKNLMRKDTTEIIPEQVVILDEM